ncbi:MAG: autotransporter domain-containing protein [Deltaproteobacteria bacterium]|jgi:uncharacterized protein with beta-barrel porin domain|nr:autotransporter domain-containing protein [Deltaproteobacteria bacterium]
MTNNPAKAKAFGTKFRLALPITLLAAIIVFMGYPALAAIPGLEFGPASEPDGDYSAPNDVFVHFVVISSVIPAFSVADPLGLAAAGVIIKLSAVDKLAEGPNGTLVNANLATYSLVGGARFDLGGGEAGTGRGNYVTVDSGGIVGRVDSGTYQGSVYGGLSYGAETIVDGNTVVIKGTVYNSVFGGAAAAAGVTKISGNKVLIDGGTVDSDASYAGKVVGGSICVFDGSDCVPATGTVSGNTVEIASGSVRDAIGGHHGNGADGAVVGGASAADGNVVSISGGTVKMASGGYASGTATVRYNQVGLSGTGTVTQSLKGGDGSTVLDNSVVITGGTLDASSGLVNVFGGLGQNVANNEVTITEGTINAGSFNTLIFGGYNDGTAVGAVSGNKISIDGSGGSLASNGKVVVTGGYNDSSGSVTGNRVTLTDVTVGQVVGGQIETATSGEISGNKVYLTGVTVNTGVPSDSNVYGGLGTDDHVISGNVITFVGGTNTIEGNVYGGLSTGGSYDKIDGNKVVFEGGTNTVKGLVSAGGELTIIDGINTLEGLVSVGGELTIIDGTNAFIGRVDTASEGHDITIAGGENTFQSDLVAAEGTISLKNTEVILDGTNSLAAKDIVIDSGGLLTFGLNAYSASLNPTGAVFVKNGGSVLFDDTVIVPLSVTGDLNVDDGGAVNFASGTGHSLDVDGALNINSGGAVNFASGTGHSLDADGAVNINSGGRVIFSADDSTLIGQGQINLNSGGSLVFDSASPIAATVKADELISFGTISLGANTLKIATVSVPTGSLVFDDGSVIEVGVDTLTTGKIEADSGDSLNVAFKDGAKIRLAQVEGAPDYWQTSRPVIIDPGSGGSISGLENVYSGFNDLYEYSGQIRVASDKITYGEAIRRAKLTISPNITAATTLLHNISVASQTNPDLEGLNDSLVKAVSAIGFNFSPEVGTAAFKQLIGESLTSVNSAVATTVLKTQSLVYNRLDRVREVQIPGPTPPSAGGEGELNRIWLGGFGIWAREDDSEYVTGYDYMGAGAAFGYDREFSGLPGLRLGISGAYAAGQIGNYDGRTVVDLTTVGVGAYGSYLLSNNVFFDVGVAYAKTENAYTTNLIVGGQERGGFNVHSWQYALRSGVIVKGDSWQLIPSAGVKYVHLRQGAFADTLDAAAAGNTVGNFYRARDDHQVDIPLLVKFNATVQVDSITYTPEFRLGYTFAVKRLDNAMDVGFIGATETAKILGTRSRGHSFQGGVGLKLNTGSGLDIFANYDVDAAKGFYSHNLSAGLGVEF